MSKVVGIDIGGTKCAVILGEYLSDGAINILEKISFPTEVEKGPDYSLNKIFRGIEDILDSNKVNSRELMGMGISCGGPLDSEKGVIMSPPNLVGWDNIPIVDMLQERFGTAARLQNDANACALAEWKFGAAKGYSNVIFLTFGTGLGAGLILNGQLYSGTNGMAGEVGHIRLENFGPVGYGKSGSFEGFCSGGGIAQLARMKVLEKMQRGESVSFCSDASMIEDISAKIVAEAAKAGDELASEVYDICGRYLGMGLSMLIDILNPQAIVIGSIFARSQELLWNPAEEVIKRESLSLAREVCTVLPAKLGDSIGDYAALAVAVY